MTVRLQKAIADAGVTSRRKAEKLIEEGLVSINGRIVTRLGTQVDPERDAIKVDGKRIRTCRQLPVLYALYKPKNCVTTMNDPQGRDTIANYFPRGKKRLFPIGRLDYDSEGMVLLTNDGDLAQRISHPSGHVWKRYFVKIKGKILPSDIAALTGGPTIDGKRRQPVRIKLLHYVNEKSWLLVSLQEGVKHHIKKMFASVGFQVQKIKRYSVGGIELKDMRPGEIRRVSQKEIDATISSNDPRRAEKP